MKNNLLVESLQKRLEDLIKLKNFKREEIKEISDEIKSLQISIQKIVDGQQDMFEGY